MSNYIVIDAKKIVDNIFKMCTFQKTFFTCNGDHISIESLRMSHHVQ